MDKIFQKSELFFKSLVSILRKNGFVSLREWEDIYKRIEEKYQIK